MIIDNDFVRDLRVLSYYHCFKNLQTIVFNFCTYFVGIITYVFTRFVHHVGSAVKIVIGQKVFL